MMWLKTQFDGNFWSISSNQRPFLLQCACTVQYSRLAVLTVVSYFWARLLAPRTRWVPPHLEIKALEGCNFVVHYGELWPKKRGKMLTPADVFRTVAG